MDALIKEHEKLSSSANLSKSVQDIEKIIEQLTQAREAIAESKLIRLL